MEGDTIGQVLHGSATPTTPAVRRAIQHSQESVRAPAHTIASIRRRYRSGSTAKQWRIARQRLDRRGARSTVLTRRERSCGGCLPICAFASDDCLWPATHNTRPLTRSSLHRCFQRHGIERLPDVEGNKAPRRSSRLIRLAISISTLPK